MAHQPPSTDISLQSSSPMPSELSITSSAVKAEELVTPSRSNDTSSSTWKATPDHICKELLTLPPLSFDDPDHPSLIVWVREESMTPSQIFFDDKRSSPVSI